MTRGSINRTRDVVSGAVASKRSHGAKREVFVDPHIPAKYDRFLAVHERAEAAAMSKGMSYARAHSTVAVPAERKAVERANAKLALPERVRKFVVASEPFTIENAQMTPTLKVRRHVVRELYAGALEALYK